MKNRFARTLDADGRDGDVILFSFSKSNRIDSFWTKKDGKWHREFSFRGKNLYDSYYFWVKDDSVK